MIGPSFNKDFVVNENGIGVAASSDTEAGKIEIATAAEMETATDTTRAVVPGRVNNHPGVAKGWIIYTPGNPPTSLASLNVTSVTRNSTGNYTITWATDFSSGNYCVAGSHNIDQGVALTSWACENTAVGSARVANFTFAGAVTDGADMNAIAAFGDQ